MITSFSLLNIDRTATLYCSQKSNPSKDRNGVRSNQFSSNANKDLSFSERSTFSFSLSMIAIIDKEKEKVERSENERSLFALLENWLERTPFLSFEGFDFWEQYSVAVRSMLSKEKEVIKSNPNYSEEEIDYHLLEHERAVDSFEAMIDPKKHNQLIKKHKKRLSHQATQAALLIFLYRDEPILHSPFNFLSRLMDMDLSLIHI